jgi:hypothetical protein
MELATILLARAIGYVEMLDLDPRGRLYYPQLVEAIVERYQFQRFPTKPEEMDESKGVEFNDGYWDGLAVEKLVIYTNGLQVDTRSSTHDSRRLVEEGLEWFRDHFGMVFQRSMITRWAFISGLTFHSEMSLTALHPALQALAPKLTKSSAIFTEQEMNYEVTSIQMTFDHLKIKNPIASFLLQRRSNASFSEKKYFSEAPMHTDEHIKALEEFEAQLMSEK